MSGAPDWDLYQSLRAVLTTGSLSAAARTLGLTQPTVGRHIEQLEQDLGQPLFTRSPQGLRPTDLAARLTPLMEAMAQTAEAVLREASGESDQLAGVIRITASEVIGAEVLPPILAAFHQLHPRTVIELSLSNRNEDLLRRDADIAVRMARPTQTALIARRVGTVRLGFYARRDYLAAHPTPRSLEDLLSLSLIGFDRIMPRLGDVSLGGIEISRELFALRTDSDLAGLAALRAGFGVGAIQHGLARRDPDLIPVLPDLLGFSLETWLVMHEDQKTSRRIRLMFDHLADALAVYVAQSQAPANSA
jgi:DNA-binding transcriptional LysR family regulator